MQKVILNLLSVAMLGLLLPACSKKTSASSTDQTTVSEPARKQRGGKQPRGERPQFADLLTKMDVDKDGRLSKTEVQGRLKDNFSKMDKDADGFISETEFENAAPPQRRKRN